MKPYYIALVIALVANACANILIKMGMRDGLPAGQGVGVLLRGILLNPLVLGGVVLFGLNVLCYAYALSRIPLSAAYPIMTSVGFLIVIGASTLLLHETLGAIQIAGIVLILAGVTMVASRLG
jgi:multidrug transporter EmrE-like cation transporter